MKVTYTGKTEALTEAQLKKVEDRFAKLAKLLDGRKGEREVHVILTSERHLHNAELTLHYRDHHLVGIASAGELFPAITDAQDRLEKQILRLREKVRDTKRVAVAEEGYEEEIPTLEPVRVTAEIQGDAGTERRVYRIDHHERRKPMTLEEALLEIESGDRNYVVYRDAETDRVAVLVRRRDGDYDLIEA